jgi:hypothetical protein
MSTQPSRHASDPASQICVNARQNCVCMFLALGRPVATPARVGEQLQARLTNADCRPRIRRVGSTGNVPWPGRQMPSRCAAGAARCAASPTRLRRIPASASSAIAGIARRLRVSSSVRTCSTRLAEPTSSTCRRAACNSRPVPRSARFRRMRRRRARQASLPAACDASRLVAARPPPAQPADRRSYRRAALRAACIYAERATALAPPSLKEK